MRDSSSVVFTSATLANATGDKGARGIEWPGYSYLEPKKGFKKVFLPAVFDYKSNTKVFLCDDTLPFFHVDFVKDTLESCMAGFRDRGRALFCSPQGEDLSSMRFYLKSLKENSPFLSKVWGTKSSMILKKEGSTIKRSYRNGKFWRRY